MSEYEKLMTQAGEAGDILLAAICQVALYGFAAERTREAMDARELADLDRYTQDSAAAECDRVMAEAAAQADE